MRCARAPGPSAGIPGGTPRDDPVDRRARRARVGGARGLGVGHRAGLGRARGQRLGDADARDAHRRLGREAGSDHDRPGRPLRVQRPVCLPREDPGAGTVVQRPGQRLLAGRLLVRHGRDAARGLVGLDGGRGPAGRWIDQWSRGRRGHRGRDHRCTGPGPCGRPAGVGAGGIGGARPRSRTVRRRRVAARPGRPAGARAGGEQPPGAVVRRRRVLWGRRTSPAGDDGHRHPAA